MNIGCRGDGISLTCPADRTSNITVSKATYGLYNMSCSDACCAPNPSFDCGEDVQTVNPDFFEYLQFICNGQSSCNFEFNGYVMDTCSGADADYLQVFFDCSQVVDGPIAFMARNLERNQLISREIVPWLNVLTNFGDHYYPQTYSFVCPISGVYVFSASIRTTSDYISVMLYKNAQRMSFTSASDDNSSDTGSCNFVAECWPGDIVWVRVSTGGYFSTASGDIQTFTGFLLHKL